MLRTRSFATAALVGLLILTGAGTAWADDPSDDPGSSASPEADGSEDPAEAGTDFRTATLLEQGQHGTADAAAGDYLYWVFPAAAGEAPRVRATVDLPSGSERTGPVTWQLDVYDGLRRRQACPAGTPKKTAPPQTEQLTLGCRLRTIQPWAETWANDPLSGAYYIRLTAVRLPEKDRGLPVRVEVETEAEAASGARRGGGRLGAPLVPTVQAGAVGEQQDGQDDADAPQDEGSSAESSEPPEQKTLALQEPESGWTGSWWSDRWAWTGGGALLAALAGIGGYRLARRR
ncbi:hypothetical protein [Streptomyces xiaopingdaonensis]|uniref:hypothetical protein n=1 Tax=Streptomyces xiaopingdaonensis TaxID=1565415 RepID=UPI0003070B10|nr:hypothetical protein [Streptomyces xiaopingdaonensis]